MSELRTMQITDILSVSAESLVDINDVSVNKDLSKKERIAEFIKQIKNPYCFKCGDFIVKARYCKCQVKMYNFGGLKCTISAGVMYVPLIT